MLDRTILDKVDAKLNRVFDNPRHAQTAADGVFMACMRSNVCPGTLIDKIESGKAFDLKRFKAIKSGNVFDLVISDLRRTAESIINITAGSNGGMASVGRGEFFFALMSDFKITLSKEGKGDLKYLKEGIYEEVKFNGGKVEVASMAGREINKRLNELAGKTINYVPFKKANVEAYSSKLINKYNGFYWSAISGAESVPMTDAQLKIVLIKTAFNKLFKVSDSILIVEEDGRFIRFTDTKSAVSYYSRNLDKATFEIRASQNNPCAMYLWIIDEE